MERRASPPVGPGESPAYLLRGQLQPCHIRSVGVPPAVPSASCARLSLTAQSLPGDQDHIKGVTAATEPPLGPGGYSTQKADRKVHFCRIPGRGWGRGMTGLKIVSRNPKLAPRPGRWHELACDVGRRLYVVEELVLQGEQKRWAQSIALEVIFGRGAAAKAIKPGVRKHFLQGAGSGG
jgi:hypothetical protein